MNNPTVFVSYSHDSDEHKSWVLKLATNLRSHGVNVILDQWDLRIGSDLRFFMENGLTETSYVLCVCSEKYVEKVNMGIGGSGYEGMIMTQELLRDAKTDHIILVVKNDTTVNKVPVAFGSKLYVDFTDDNEYISNYQKLLERIYNEDVTAKPPLGANPFVSKLANEIAIKTSMEQSLYHSIERQGSVTFEFANNNGVYNIGVGNLFFSTKWSRAGNNSIHAYGNIGYKADVINFPLKEELLNFNFSSRTRTIRTGQVVVYVNDSGNFLAIKMGDVKSSNHGYKSDEMSFEYKIYDLSN